jgi:hypothetical protein
MKLIIIKEDTYRLVRILESLARFGHTGLGITPLGWGVYNSAGLQSEMKAMDITGDFDAIIINERSGEPFIREIQALSPKKPFAIITNYGDGGEPWDLENPLEFAEAISKVI